MTQNQRANTENYSRDHHVKTRANPSGGQDEYVYGNAVRKADVRRQDVRREMEEVPRKVLSNTTRKNREKAHHMSLGYVVFLMTALFTAGFVLLNYIQLQAEMTIRVESISKMESQLNNLKLKNEETYNHIVSSVDLEEIKRIAIGELGMTYAKEGQIETYSNEGFDYMRKIGEE